MRRIALGTLCLTFIALVAPSANAQTEEVSNAALRFNFSPPGARSLAMGGAFIALADDATASFANPAGLTKLLEREISVEARYWNVEHQFTDRGRLNGVPTGRGIDTYDEIVGTSVTKNDPVASGDFGRPVTLAMPYASIVLPFDGVVLSAYYHQPLQLEYRFGAQGGLYDQVGSSSDPGRVFPYGVVGNYDIRAAGVGAAFRLGDSVSLGVSAAMNFFAADVATVYFDRPFSDPTLPIPPGDSEASVSVDDSDSSVSFNLGLTWDISESFAVGAVYHHGASFDYATTYSVRRQVAGEPRLDVAVSTPSRFNVPHVYGIGLAYLPSANWRISVDYQRIQYSRLSDDFSSVYATDLGDARPNIPDVDEIDLFNPSSFNAEDFAAVDGDQVHVGIEYGFFNLSQPFFLRGGF